MTSSGCLLQTMFSGLEELTQVLNMEVACRFCDRRQPINLGLSKVKWERCRDFLEVQPQDRSRSWDPVTGYFTYLHLPLFLEDVYDTLPDLFQSQSNCDFCRFLKDALRSREARWKIAALGVDLRTETIPIWINVQFSWNLTFSKDVGLDSLIIGVFCTDSSLTTSRPGATLREDSVCELRYSVTPYFW
jgi:hypothetical protein